MSAQRPTFADLAGKLGPNWVEVGGELVHRSRLTPAHLAAGPQPVLNLPQAATAAAPRFGPERGRAIRWADLDADEIVALYGRATAVLTILGYNARSTNELKWRHWVHHLRERRRTSWTIDSSAFWKVPLGGLAPAALEAPERRELAFVRYGGRRLDYANFADGCKSALDHLKTLRLVWDDSPTWTKQHYHQLPGGEKKLEILFLAAGPDGRGGPATLSSS